MRQPAKPFVREYKSRKSTKTAGLFDAGMMFDDELPSRDINADLIGMADEGRDARYEAALRAADNLFGGSKRTPEPQGAQLEAEKRTVHSDLTYIDRWENDWPLPPPSSGAENRGRKTSRGRRLLRRRLKHRHPRQHEHPCYRP